MIYLLIGGILYAFTVALLWCVIRSGSEYRKPTPKPPRTQREFDILELERLWRTR